MAVLQCAGCPRLISVSAIAGGNPIAKANPEQWSVRHVRCPGCGQALCDRCAVEAGGKCKLCGAALPAIAGAGTPARPASATRLSAATRARIDAITWGRHWGLLAMVLQGAFPFVIMMSTSNAVPRTAYWLSTLMGMWAGWKMLGGMGAAPWKRLLVALTQFMPMVALLVLLLVRRRAASAILELQDADDAEEDDEAPPARKTAPAAPLPVQPASAATAGGGPVRAPAAPAPLDALAQRIAQAMGKPVRGYSTYDFGREQQPAARSILVDKDFPLDLLMRLRRMLPPGLVLFLGTDRWLGSEDHGSQVELVIAPGKDYTDMVRVAQVDPVNHGLDPDQVAAKLVAYDRQHGIRVYNASTDTLGFQFARLPADVVALARDLMAFCPDLCDAYATPEDYAAALKEAHGGVTLWWD